MPSASWTYSDQFFRATSSLQPGRAAHLCQAAQQVQERLVALIDHVLITGRHGLGVGSPHGGVVAVGPSGRPARGVAVEHLLLLLVADAGFRLELIRRGDPALVVAGGGVVGIDRAAHHLGRVGTHGVGIEPGDPAAAGVGIPVFDAAIAPDHVEGRTLHVPGSIVIGIFIGLFFCF